MIQLVLLELCQGGGTKHTFPFHVAEYLRHVNNRSDIIVGNPHNGYKAVGYASEPSVGDILHLKLFCNGNKVKSATYEVHQYFGQRHVHDDGLIPKGKRIKTGRGHLPIDNAHYCVIKKINGRNDTRKPLEICCICCDTN